MEEPYYQKSEFHGSVDTLQRISRIIESMHEFSRLIHAPAQNQHRIGDVLYTGGLHNANLWQDCVLNLYDELLPNLDPKEISEAENKFFPHVEYPIIFTDKLTEKTMIRTAVHKLIKNFKRWILSKLKRHGLLIKVSADPRTAMLR